MSTIPTPTKAPAVTMTFTVTMNLPEEPSLQAIERAIASAKEAKAALSKLNGVVTGEVTIGKQKFKLENEAS